MIVCCSGFPLLLQSRLGTTVKADKPGAASISGVQPLVGSVQPSTMAHVTMVRSKAGEVCAIKCKCNIYI